jgi:hypothetical protein
MHERHRGRQGLSDRLRRSDKTFSPRAWTTATTYFLNFLVAVAVLATLGGVGEARGRKVPAFVETGCSDGSCVYQDRDGTWRVKPDPKRKRRVATTGCPSYNDTDVLAWIAGEADWPECL